MNYKYRLIDHVSGVVIESNDLRLIYKNFYSGIRYCIRAGWDVTLDIINLATDENLEHYVLN